MIPKKLEFFLMRKITSKRLLDALVKRKARSIGKTKLKGGPSIFIDAGSEDRHTKELRSNGFTILDRPLSENELEQIIAFSETKNCYDHYNDSNAPVDVRNAPGKTHVAHFKREELVQNPLIMKIANDPGLLAIVQEFLGAKPTISNINMWWSFGGRKQAEHAQLFHRDFDDWKFCKLFIYLTDVKSTSGPHIYVRSSSASPKLRKIRRYSDKEVNAAFGKENVIQFEGKRGTAFLVDTYGFHKGLLPEKEDRLLLQVQYSLYPIAVENYQPVKVGHGFDRHINRLLTSN
jgi:hypothetical protein